MKNGTILHEISTHKAVVQGSEIVIFEIGMIVDGEICTEETRRTFPEWFEDKELWRIPLDQRDDLLAIFDRLEETNRINVAEAIAEF